MNQGTADLIRSSLRGTVDVKMTEAGLTPVRLPLRALAQSDADWMRIAAEQASGVRCEFRTAATWIELTVETTGLHLPWVPEGVRWAVFSATLDGEPVADARVTGGSELHLGEPEGPRFVKGEPAVVRFELGGSGVEDRRVVVWLPQTDTVEIRDVRADAPLRPAEALDQLRWWHHGSSISHCIEATTPRGVWPVAAADRLTLDVTNLGFAANAHLDQYTARAMRDSDADLFSLKIGINIVGGDTMKRRTFVPAVHGFLDTIRDGAPTAPILVISPIICPMHEETPGPTVTDPETGQRRGTPILTSDPFDPPLTLRAVREILRGIVQQRAPEDPALFYLDGLELFGEADLDELPDGLHPSAAGYLRIAGRFAASPVVSEWRMAATSDTAPAADGLEDRITAAQGDVAEGVTHG